MKHIADIVFAIFIVAPAYMLSTKKYDDPEYWKQWRESAPPWFD